MDLKESYDRVLLVVFGLIAIVVGALLTKGALALPDKFARQDKTKAPDFGESGLAQAEAAAEHIKNDFTWASAAMPGVPQKALRLTASVPVWVKDGKEYDLLDPNTPALRPPLENIYIHEHNLPAGRSDLVDLDTDGDGFTNEREFLDGKTDPTDKSDHPEFSNKLRLAEVKKDEYILELRTSGGATGEHGIRETTNLFQGEPIRRRTHYVKQNDAAFGLHPGHEDRYKVTGFQPLQKAGNIPGVMVDAHQLTIEDLRNPGNPFTIVQREPKIFPTYYAALYYGLPGVEKNLDGFYKVGDTFELPNQAGVKYEVLELDGDPTKGVKIRKLASGDSPAKDFIVPPQ